MTSKKPATAHTVARVALKAAGSRGKTPTHPKGSTADLKASIRRAKLRRYALYGYASLLVISGVAALAIGLHQRSKPLPDPFPSAQRQAVHIKLYYPAHLPANYQIDVASADSIENSVVVLRATNPIAGTDMSFSQQAAPQDFNFNILYNSFEDKASFKTKLGTAYTGTIDNGKTRIASLVTADKTWILINAPGSVPASDLQTTLKSFRAEQ